MSTALPCSTLALAIGHFQQSEQSFHVDDPISGKQIPVTMYAACSLIDPFTKEFLQPACDYLKAAMELLGEYPFSRLDLVMMPRCFACMGLERYVRS